MFEGFDTPFRTAVTTLRCNLPSPIVSNEISSHMGRRQRCEYW